MTRRSEDETTGLWSLQVSSRQIARVARRLRHARIDEAELLARVERHLDAVAALLELRLQNDSPIRHDPRGIVALTQRMLRHHPAGARVALTEAGPTPPSHEHTLLLHARLGPMATTDLIGFLCAGEHTGILQVLTEQEDFTIEIEGGCVVHAFGDAAPPGERLGDILVEHGVLSVSALEELLAQQDDDERLGALVQRHGVGHTELLRALETQIERLFCRLFRSSPREFLFWQGPCLGAEDSMHLNANRLLLEAACAFDTGRPHESFPAEP